MDRLNSGMEETAESIPELEDRIIEIAHCKQQRENRLEKDFQKFRTFGTIIKDLRFVPLGVLEAEEKEAELEEFPKSGKRHKAIDPRS